MSDLLPCPFCGGEAVLTEGKYKHYNYVGCGKCNVKIDVIFSSTQDATKAWNARPAVELPSVEVPSAEEILETLKKPFEGKQPKITQVGDRFAIELNEIIDEQVEAIHRLLTERIKGTK